MKYERDAERLRELLYRHTPVGQEVIVPIFGEATVLEQDATNPVRHVTESATRLGNPMVYYKVRAKKPVPFKDWVQRRFPHHPSERVRAASRAGPEVKLTLEDWRREWGRNIPSMPDYVMTRLEQGGAVSFEDIEFEELSGRGCLDEHGNVNCYTFWQNDVEIGSSQLRKGDFIQYVYGSGDGQMTYPGRVLGFGRTEDDQKLAYLELLTPVPYLDCPDSIASNEIEESFSPEGTYALGYGTYEALEIAEEESGEKLIPPGKWDTEDVRERRIYTLKEFLPISVVIDVCNAAYGDEPHCFWQSLILYVVPILLSVDAVQAQTEGRAERMTWRPLPKRSIDPLEAVISYDFEE